jgi:hypothetical protein
MALEDWVVVRSLVLARTVQRYFRSHPTAAMETNRKGERGQSLLLTREIGNQGQSSLLTQHEQLEGGREAPSESFAYFFSFILR